MDTFNTSHTSVDVDQGLAALVDPIATDDFLRDFLGKAPVLIRGDESRFSDCGTWSVVDEFLASTWFDRHRMRVKGKETLLAPTSYVEPAPQIAPRGNPYRFQPQALKHVLADEGTLVVDCFEYHHVPLRRLIGRLEQTFQAVTQANLYMNRVNADAQSILHWDDHEVFVLQVEGSKRWTLHAPTMPDPVDVFTDPPAPAPESVHWDGVLRKGEMLYVPRGWWHKVRASEGPSLHLSCSVRLPWGGQLLRQLLAHLVTEFPGLRRNLPLEETESGTREWGMLITDAVTRSMKDPALIDLLLKASRQAPAARPSYAFALEQE
ncbi:JmjC domain-containing protein [Streptomyces adustus]|uniref:JmjC domain-containing protein n=1 Tax=Streptomyces adustus TaxID=1609272 RepID=UPI0035DD21E3